jgi:hypothetical protein
VRAINAEAKAQPNAQCLAIQRHVVLPLALRQYITTITSTMFVRLRIPHSAASCKAARRKR